jgi:predicted DNA-binding transcriptional regulator AlpA
LQFEELKKVVSLPGLEQPSIYKKITTYKK